MTEASAAPDRLAGAGVLPDHELRAAMADGWITASVPPGDEQFQPASLDLRLGPIAYQLRASFLPFRESVQDRLDGDGDLVIDRLSLAEGATGGMFKAVGSYLPPPPDFAESPLLWGSQAHVREMLEPHGLELDFKREQVVLERESAEDLVRFYEDNFGPIIMARKALGSRWPELRRDLVHNFETWNQADDGSVHIEADYLVTVGRK